MTPPEKVLVVLSRTTAQGYVSVKLRGHAEFCGCVKCETRSAIHAALDRDPEELVDRVAEALYMAPWTEMGGFPEVVWERLGKHEREPHLLAARAVIATIGGEQDG